MIGEDTLRRLLAEAADSAPPPGGLPDDLFAGIAADQAEVPHPAFRQPRKVLAVAAAVLVVIAFGAALVNTDGGGHDDAATSVALAPTEEADMASGAGGNAASSSDSASALVDSAQVVKTGSISVELDEGTYERSVDLLTTKVAGLGGYVSQSSTSRAGEQPAGSMVLRVPAAQFDALMTDLRKLGEVLSEDSQGVDVGGQVADLDARLSALRATRDRLTAILAEAGSVDETLAVQDRITGVQTQIEQLEGQQRVLADQVAMSSITVSLGEPGAERVELSEDDRDLGGAWAEARHRFGDGVEDLVAWSGSAALVLLVGATLTFGLRLVWPRLRRMLL